MSATPCRTSESVGLVQRPDPREGGGQSRVGSRTCRGPIKRGRERVAREEEEEPSHRSWWRQKKNIRLERCVGRERKACARKGAKKGPARLHSLPRCGACSKEDHEEQKVVAARSLSHSLLVLPLLIARLIAATLTHPPLSLITAIVIAPPPRFQKRETLPVHVCPT